MKKTFLRSAMTMAGIALFMTGNAMASPIATGPWTEYEYYQKTTEGDNSYMGQYVEKGDSFDFLFDLAFLGNDFTTSDLGFENDVEGYASYLTPVGDVWASVSIFSIDAEKEKFNLDVVAYWNGEEYDLGKTVFNATSNNDELTFIYKFSGELLSAWQNDPYGLVTISLKGFGKNGVYNDFNLTEVGIGLTAVPEPTTMLLFGAGLAGLAGINRRKRN
jgi:hypothetical protein